MTYPKDQRISDLDSSACDAANLKLGLQAIRNSAEKAGDKELTAKAVIWIEAAEALSASVNQTLNIERETHA